MSINEVNNANEDFMILLNILGIRANRSRSKEIFNLIKKLSDKPYWKIKELEKELGIRYKTIYKYISELNKLGLIEKQEFVNGLFIGLKKDFKRILKQKIKQKYNELSNLVDSL